MTASRSDADCNTTVAPRSSRAPGATWGRNLSRFARYCGGYRNGAQPVPPTGLGVYVAALFAAAGFLDAVFRAADFVAAFFFFFMRRTLQQRRKCGQ